VRGDSDWSTGVVMFKGDTCSSDTGEYEEDRGESCVI
jgi:hypothetical protein